MIITYSQLRGWRNLCEYLNGCWYKFANPDEIRKAGPGILPALYDPSDRHHRERLFDNYLIQFITWQEHPILTFRSGRGIRRQFQGDWGWRLMVEWEWKIDYLEQVVLFGQEPPTKHWEPGLRSRMQQREERRKKLEAQQQLAAMQEAERRRLAAEQGICWRCTSNLAFMMVDCVVCGQVQ